MRYQSYSSSRRHQLAFIAQQAAPLPTNDWNITGPYSVISERVSNKHQPRTHFVPRLDSIVRSSLLAPVWQDPFPILPVVPFGSCSPRPLLISTVLPFGSGSPRPFLILPVIPCHLGLIPSYVGPAARTFRATSCRCLTPMGCQICVMYPVYQESFSFLPFGSSWQIGICFLAPVSSVLLHLTVH